MLLLTERKGVKKKTENIRLRACALIQGGRGRETRGRLIITRTHTRTQRMWRMPTVDVMPGSKIQLKFTSNSTYIYYGAPPRSRN